MIDLYYWPTPNGHKVTLFLEEAGLQYALKPVDIGKGEQFEPAFLQISPNNKMRPSSTMHRPMAAVRRACSSPGRSCCIWPRRPAASCRAMPAAGSLHWNGCSGRWAGWAR